MLIVFQYSLIMRIMNIKMKIRTKMLISILGAVVLIYSVSIGFISMKIKNDTYKEATKYIDAFISENANIATGEFNADMITVRTLAQSFVNYDIYPKGKRAEIVRSMYQGVFDKNPQFYALWDSWELSEIDPTWKLPYGRYVENFWREGDKVSVTNEFKNLDGDSGDYERIKREAIESAEEPYFYSYTKNKEDEILMSSFISPIVKNGKYIGVVGIDISLEYFQKRIESLKPFKDSYAFLISNNGIIIAHPNKDFINKSVEEVYKNDEIATRTKMEIQRGNNFNFIRNHYKLGVPSYFSFAPIKIGQSKTPWSMGIAIPVDTILLKVNDSINRTILIGLVGLLLIILIVWFIAHYITQPLVKVANYARLCSKGDYSHSIDISREDEIGDLANALKEMTSSFVEISEIAKKISGGDLTTQMEDHLTNKEGDLVKSFKEMIGKLRSIIKEISSSTDELLQTASSLNNNSVKINEGGNDQESFSIEVNKSMNEIENISVQAVNHVAEGVEKVSSTVSSLKGIISKTKVIEDIYIKTNFISLNAAVEAARAGDHGRGFAVVAKEIQKLAEQSKIAVTDIDHISKGSIIIAEESLKSLETIVREIQQTSSYIKRIIDSEDHSKRNGSTNLVRLKEITDENLRISKDIASNAESLASNATNLKSLINYFRIN